MRIEYKNERGTLVIGGGSHSDFNMTAIEGLGPVDKIVNSTSYFGQPGIDTINAVDGGRVISVSGDLLLADREQYSIAMSILNISGILAVVLPDGARRLIDVAYTSVTPSERRGAWRTYVIQFFCDYPYFRASNELVFNAYRKIDHLDNSLVLPGIFSTEYNNRILNYGGNASGEPSQIIIDVSNLNRAVIFDNDANGVMIQNVTTDEAIYLDYQMSPGEQININVQKRTITNQYGHNLMRFVAPDTFLDGFHLIPGENNIFVACYQHNVNININIFYTDMYVEAVY